ncbi:MAG: flagellar biosynthesis protein FlhF, partial [Spirochaetales bacterium]|nr:flagellar biosynthesis protein FlhF [Spirochaetales bacterium]
MEYFKEVGTSYMEAVSIVKSKFGENAKILNHRSIRYGGFLGMFQKEGVEVEGYFNAGPVLSPRRNFDEEKKKLIAAAGAKRDDSLSKVLDKLNLIDEKIEAGTIGGQNSQPESIEKIEELLVKNDFSYNVIKDICTRLKSELSLEQLKDYDFVKRKTLQWLGDNVKVYRGVPTQKGKVVILVGPTGVGKTTTLAKLAAINRLGIKGESPKDVRLITIDNFRIGAQGQIQTYGDLMDIPVSCVDSIEDFRSKIMLYQEADMILVDTMGRSPRDYQNLAQMRELLDVCG